MKKLVCLLFFVYCSAFAQESFEYKAPELLIGKKIKVTKSTDYLKKEGYRDFYKKPKCDYSSRIKASFEKFYNQEFTLIGIQEKPGILKYKILELQNEKKDIIYYEYDCMFGGESWIFTSTEPLIIPDNYWCNFLDIKTDKFTGKTMTKTTSSEYIFLLKDEDGVYLYLKSPGSTITIGKKEVTILLADGSKIINSNHLIDVKASMSSGYDYTVLIKLNKDDIQKLKSSYITDYRLYIYDFQPHEPKFIQKEFNCILKDL